MNIKNIFNNPKILLAIGGGFLGIAFIDVLAVTDASSISEMTWWGQSAVYMFLGILSAFAVGFFLISIGKWFINLFKKK